jgi:hypothetical protein
MKFLAFRVRYVYVFKKLVKDGCKVEASRGNTSESDSLVCEGGASLSDDWKNKNARTTRDNVGVRQQHTKSLLNWKKPWEAFDV